MDTLFDKSSTALVVIDLQKGIIALPVQPNEAQTVIDNAAKMAAAFRRNHMPLFIVNVSASPDGKDRLLPITDGVGAWSKAQLSADWSEIVPELDLQKDDQLVGSFLWYGFRSAIAPPEN